MFRKIIQSIFIYFIRILLCLLLVIFGYDKLNNDSFIEEIEQYEIFGPAFIDLIVMFLPSIEILVGMLILLPAQFTSKIKISVKFRHFIHLSYLMMMISFCLILLKGRSIGINDCGCGISQNPLDIFAKQIWSWYSGEIIVGINASILRNLMAIVLLSISSLSIHKNNV
jgi:hypothetical protein